MTTGGAMTTAQANCVADKVLAEVSVSDLAKAGTSSSLPADVQSKVTAAVGACASAS